MSNKNRHSYLEFLKEKHNNNPLINTILVRKFLDSDTDIDKPIHILFICSGNENLIISPQINIDINRSSSATVIEQYANETSSFFQNNCVLLLLKKMHH